MDIKKKKDLEEKLRLLFDQSQKKRGVTRMAKKPLYQSTIIRRRKGVPDQSIPSIPTE